MSSGLGPFQLYCSQAFLFQLVFIHENTFKGLKYLTELRLDGNLLIEFPVWQLTANPSLSYLTLASNW